MKNVNFKRKRLKLGFISACCFIFCFSSAVSAQTATQTITIDQKDKPVGEILKAIESVSDYVFFYNKDDVDRDRKATVQANNASIEKVLDQLFAKTNNGYRMEGRQVYITKKAPAVEKSPQQVKKKVTGKVIDKNGEPLPGVSIIVKGSTRGALTDIDGSFEMDNVDVGATLTVSLLGMESKEIQFQGQVDLIVVLEEKASELSEVTIVAFGAQKKASVVGAIETIKPEALAITSKKNISNTLAGKLPGIIAVTRSGEPGYDQSNFWIRGLSSFSGNTTPLVLIDGVQRNLDDMDIMEVESFSVLKDAAASAMYGVRGANGVILINTRRGKVQKPEVYAKVEHSFTAPTQLPKFIGAADHMQLLNDIAADAGRMPYYDQKVIDYTRSGYDPELYPDVDWIDAIFKPYAFNDRVNLNVNGGTEILRYNLTASYYHEGGLLERDKSLPYNTGINLNRYNLRANVDLNLTKTTSMRFNVGGYLEKVRRPTIASYVIWYEAYASPPMKHPIKYADGKIPSTPMMENPWGALTQSGYNINSSSKIESLFAIEQQLDFFTKGLSSKLSFSFDNYSESTLARSKASDRYLAATSRNDEGDLILTQTHTGSEFLEYANGAAYGNNQTYLEWMVNYDRTFNDDHNVNALLLYNQRSYDDGGIQPYRNQGIAGRAAYSYKNKYIGEFNFGYNGSENFAKGQRFGFFPSVAAGWIVSEEDFWAPVSKTIDFLKIRASWGKAGNDQIDADVNRRRRFGYLTTMNTGAEGYAYGSQGAYWVQGITEGEIGVSNLTWETVTKQNLGMEISFFRALRIQADIFQEHRENIFMQRRTTPSQTGFLTTPWSNIGEAENWGGELAVSFDKKINEVSLSFFANMTYAKNKITYIDTPPGQQGTHQDQTGHSINELYGYRALRLYTDDDFNPDGTLLATLPQNELAMVRPGDIMFHDWNEDGVINSKDQGYVGGTVDPRLVYGFGGTVAFYGFDFSFFFQGVGDTYRIIGNTGSGAYRLFIPGSGQGALGNIYDNYTDRWTVDNPSQDVFWPRLSYLTNENNYAASTWWKKDMRFLRLRQVELGYSFPKSVTKNWAKMVRVYVSAENLLTSSKFKLWDPELDTVTGEQYPLMKSVMLGLEVTF
ncbi:MAG: TonB-dependent receptor [Bacteroidales bacterium]|jgi:TonB-linked SusC/RagA family outer membrane protein|nr:TonB-dependent receptor [Bacteroidales bacterium]